MIDCCYPLTKAISDHLSGSDVPRKSKVGHLKEFLAEVVGTFILVAFVLGSATNFALNTNGHQHHDQLAATLSCAVGAMLGMLTAGPVSGAHLNPAVTVAFAVTRRVSWSKVPTYLLGQYFGAFLAAAVVFLTNLSAINKIDGGHRLAQGNATATGHIFADFPDNNLSMVDSFFDQVISTGLLMFAIMTISDRNGINCPGYIQPLFVSLAIFAIAIVFGSDFGAILNPARDFGPRFFAMMAGYGMDIFRPVCGLFWIVSGIVGPHVGGVLGAVIYTFTIYPPKNDEPEVRHSVSPDFPKTITGRLMVNNANIRSLTIDDGSDINRQPDPLLTGYSNPVFPFVKPQHRTPSPGSRQNSPGQQQNAWNNINGQDNETAFYRNPRRLSVVF